MMKEDSSKDLNLIFRVSDIVTSSIFKNNLRIIKDPQPKSLRILRLSEKSGLLKEVCTIV